MNIFEQFGIKEVANCTLFSIELDDNDEECALKCGCSKRLCR